MEEELSDWVQDYLETDEDYLLLTDENKFRMFQVYRTILGAVSRTVHFKNVYPILIASNPTSKAIIQGALNNLAQVLPQANKITVSLMH